MMRKKQQVTPYGFRDKKGGNSNYNAQRATRNTQPSKSPHPVTQSSNISTGVKPLTCVDYPAP